MPIASPSGVLDFWFGETHRESWFRSDPDFHATLRHRFEETWRSGREGRLNYWTETRQGTLALILLFDQFPRNMFRGRAEAFATDAAAREAAQDTLDRGLDLLSSDDERSFFYLPLMHSEDLADQERCIALTRERLGVHHFSYPYAIRHRNVIARFGRFPARNAALGRATTVEEREFLTTHPSGL